MFNKQIEKELLKVDKMELGASPKFTLGMMLTIENHIINLKSEGVVTIDQVIKNLHNSYIDLKEMFVHERRNKRETQGRIRR